MNKYNPDVKYYYISIDASKHQMVQLPTLMSPT
jgi:hypothetical protein